MRGMRTAETAIGLVARELESALPPTGLLAAEFYGEDETNSDGQDADTLLFTSCGHTPVEDVVGCDVRQVELAFGQSADGEARALLRYVTANLLAPETVDAEESVLCRGVRGFNLRYYDGMDWQDTWDSTVVDNALPIAVEITLEVDREDREIPLSSDDAEDVYRICRIVVLPCYNPGQEGTQIIRSSGR